jgi:hypothetical protein
MSRKRINAESATGGRSRIRAAEELVPSGLLTFSYKYAVLDHPKFRLNDRQPAYFLALLERLKNLSLETVPGLISSRPNSATRFHPIQFVDAKVTETGFGIPRCEAFDDVAWQFSISVNEHGRVHGFLIDSVFFIVWFDPEHRLYA